MKIILIGAPGCGKGTQADYICSKYNIPHISTSNLIRESISSNNEQSKQIQEQLNAGKLISDELVLKLLKNRIQLNDCSHGYLLDGFPRTINQAQVFESIDSIDVVIYIKANTKTIIERIKNRKICIFCGKVCGFNNLKICPYCGGKLIKRKDDDLAVFEKRLRIYNEETLPVIEFYKQKDRLVEVSNNSTTENTFIKIENILSNLR